LRLNTREDTKRGQLKVFLEDVIASNKQFQRIDYKTFGNIPLGQNLEFVESIGAMLKSFTRTALLARVYQ
jgi:hypothetical protein